MHLERRGASNTVRVAGTERAGWRATATLSADMSAPVPAVAVTRPVVVVPVVVVPVLAAVTQVPWPEQLDAHSWTEQSGPPKPSKQEQRPSDPQIPRPEHPPGHSTPLQSSPLRPLAHMQTPWRHIPNGEWQSTAHSRSQKRPRAATTNPGSQRHAPSMHAPWAPHAPPLPLLFDAGLHANTSHRSPRQPGSHAQVAPPLAREQWPCGPQFVSEHRVGRGRWPTADLTTMAAVASPQPSP